MKTVAEFIGQNWPKIKATVEWKKIKTENPAAAFYILETFS